MKKKYNIQIGDLFYVPFTEAIILVSSVPNGKTVFYRGIYKYETKERNIGSYDGLQDAIDKKEWIYYPVVR
jgi:hypothetical protein